MSSVVPPEGTADRLLALGSATLGESGGIPLPSKLKPMWPAARFAAPAFTVASAPADNLAMHAAIPRAVPGTVMAVSVAGDVARGYWGEVMTVAAQAAGIVALVIDGTVRDVDALHRRRFPVFARGTALRGATKVGPGAMGGPVTIADTLVCPGDWLVGDVDGLVVIRAEDLADCQKAALARAQKEERFFDALQTGKTTVELLGLDVSSIAIL